MWKGCLAGLLALVVVWCGIFAFALYVLGERTQGAVGIAMAIFIPATPVVLLGGAAAFTFIFVPVGTHRRYRRLRQALPASRRGSMSAVAAAQHLGVNGTFIYEQPSVGWSNALVWWTPRDVTAEAIEAGMTIPPELSPALPESGDYTIEALVKADRLTPWLQKRHLDREGGDAILVGVVATPWGAWRWRRNRARHAATPVLAAHTWYLTGCVAVAAD